MPVIVSIRGPRADVTSRGRVAGKSASCGFTLIELMVVMALVAILMGLGVGFLQRRGDDIDLALATVRDQLRIAHLSARTRHLPSEVLIRPATDNGPATVRARVLEPVGHWHMEERTALDDDIGLDSQVTGRVEPGRFGMARRPEVGVRAALLTVPTRGLPRFDLSEGFAFRVDLKLDERAAMTVMRFGTGLDLRLDERLIARSRMVSQEGGGQTGVAVDLEAPTPLRLGRWHTMELVHDGQGLAMRIDGRDVDRALIRDPLYQTAQDEFLISDPASPVLGLVDSVALWAYAMSPAQVIPSGVLLRADPAKIGFDRHGDLLRPVAMVFEAGEDRRLFTVGPGGILE